VSHCLPTGYERYLKLLHPIYEDQSVVDHHQTWDDVARAERPLRRAMMTEEAQRVEGIIHDAGGVARQSQPDQPFPAKRVLWSDLAKQWHRTYHPAITDHGLVPSLTSWPRYLVGPAEGKLVREQRAILAETVAPFNADGECFFWWMTIFREEAMWRGRLEDYPHADEVQAERRSPNMVWPSRRHWCICTDYDLCFTLVGCSTPIADAFLSRPELELLEVTPTTRIDYKADEANASPK